MRSGDELAGFALERRQVVLRPAPELHPVTPRTALARRADGGDLVRAVPRPRRQRLVEELLLAHRADQLHRPVVDLAADLVDRPDGAVGVVALPRELDLARLPHVRLEGVRHARRGRAAGATGARRRGDAG